MRPHPPGHLLEKDFANDRDKWAFLEGASKLDALDPRVRELASHLWEASGHQPREFAALAQSYCRDVVRYMTDTDQYGGEDIAPAGRVGDVIESLVDDCDAKARLFVALCVAVRIEARMVAHWTGAELSHVSAAARIGGKEIPVELTLARARLGENPKDVPKEVTGHWALNEARSIQ